MNKLLTRVTFAISVSVTLAVSSGCKMTDWFASHPTGRASQAFAETFSPSTMNAGYLAGGPTFSNVQSVYEPEETATERAIRLRAENDQLRVAITDRDRQLADWQQRYETKERLLHRVESDLRDSIADVTKASQQLDAWRSELSALHAKTRNETESSVQAFETLSQQVERILMEMGGESGSASDSNQQREPRKNPASNEPEPIFPLPAQQP